MNDKETKENQRAEQQPGVTPSGYTGDNPSTAGPGKTQVQSPGPENKEGKLNPSAPADTSTTPGSTGEK